LSGKARDVEFWCLSRDAEGVFFSKMKTISAATLPAVSDTTSEELDASSLQESAEQFKSPALNMPLAATMLPSDMDEKECTRTRTWPGLAPHVQPTLTMLTRLADTNAITMVATSATHAHSRPWKLTPMPRPPCIITPRTNTSMFSITTTTSTPTSPNSSPNSQLRYSTQAPLPAST
jgi:hypothetical protein